MFLRLKLLHALAVICLSAICLCQGIAAEVATADNAISNLYENLLQREYAGPVVFPNHQVERKAQRSPSLRLRFGRRNDPDMLPSAEKRWFGDVNQKPIRSPSLRLRFGRRSDPSMPLHSQLDALMNELAVSEGEGEGEGHTLDDYADDAYDGLYERVVRKPQRLRWGRSVPMEGANDLEHERQEQRQRTDDFFNSLLSSDKLRNMLLTLRQYDAEPAVAALTDEPEGDAEFQREVRKPAPLRLRWGRSTGGRSPAAVNGEVGMAAGSVQADKQKKAVAQNAVNLERTPTNNGAQQQAQKKN